MTETDAAWTIDQLSELVAAALSAGYDGQSNGRVRDVPDIRTIRWYTSIGLLDRPAAMRGRTALYVRRHLLQLVAIKRLQADGATLAAVQRELIGADDATLERIARLAPNTAFGADVAEGRVGVAVPDGAVRPRFWAARPSADVTPTATTPPTVTVTPTTAPTTIPTTKATPTAPKPKTSRKAPLDTAPTTPALVQGLRLNDDVTLLLSAADRAPDEAALSAVRAAAEPLLELLRALGLSAS